MILNIISRHEFFSFFFGQTKSEVKIVVYYVKNIQSMESVMSLNTEAV